MHGQLGGAARDADNAKQELRRCLAESSIKLTAFREQLGGAAREIGNAEQGLLRRLEKSSIELAALHGQRGNAARDGRRAREGARSTEVLAARLQDLEQRLSRHVSQLRQAR